MADTVPEATEESMEVSEQAAAPMAGVKRPLEEPPPPEPAPGADAAAAGVAEEQETGGAPAEGAAPESTGAAQAAPPVANEEATLQREIAWLHQQNAALQQQLAGLQQQHMALTSQAHQQAAARAHAAPAAQAPAPSLRHNQAWTEQVNSENGQTYYWHSQTGESTYTRPHDFNPGASNAQSSVLTSNLPQTKGPPGANLFVVRKMRRGEYDEFNDADLAREFGKYGTVTRAEMTIDKENGWSKGFGFVSFATVEEADAAMAAVHGSWMAGREMKVEKTHDN